MGTEREVQDPNGTEHRSNQITIRKLMKHINNSLLQLREGEGIANPRINESGIARLTEELEFYRNLPPEITLGEAIKKGLLEQASRDQKNPHPQNL